ncbi:MAG TPA: Ig-like domain-containing protein [Bacteroidales bacterium]|nr:Ig-like domain-containing protein [Bacteroidales bacterium]
MKSEYIVKRFIIIILILFLIYSCAKIGSPTGGPRDREPPVVIKTLPVAEATGYSGYKVEITLDEYVALENINENLIVSPPAKKKPKVWIKGKTVIAEFGEDFKDSTTYCLNFQDAIKDLNEGNILEDYQFAFSTSSVLDSLSVTGNVYNADNLEVPEKLFVLMYRELADSAVKKLLPDYIALIDHFGYFRINYVRPGIYNLFALQDADNNKLYNLDDEAFAFLDSPISVTADSNWLPVVKDTLTVKEVLPVKTNARPGLKINPRDTIALSGKNKLMLFIKAPFARYLKSSERKINYQLEYVLSLPPDSMEFEFSIPDTDSSSYLVERSLQRDTMIVWLTDTALYNQSQITSFLRYPATDTAGVVDIKTDTVQLRYIPPKATRNSTIIKPVALKISNNMPAGAPKPGQLIIFSAETPLHDPDTSMIRLYDITKKDTLKVPFRFTRDNHTATKYILDFDILPEKKYFFVSDSGAFVNYYGECSDSIGIKISQKPADSYSKLTFNIKNGEGEMIIQLLDKTEKSVIREAERKEDGIVEFPLLEPGTYRAKVIFDTDGDGKWTTGDFSKLKLPEDVSYYPKELEIKAKFELEQDWDVGVKCEKDMKLRAVKK